MMVGKLTAVSREQLNEMEEVLSVLRLGNCQPQQAPVKIPLMRKGVKHEDIARTDDNSHAVRHEIEMEEEAVEIDIEMTDVIWDLKEDDLSDCSDDPSADVSIGTKNSQRQGTVREMQLTGKRSERNKCPECQFDNNTMQGSINHLLMLVADTNYQIRSSPLPRSPYVYEDKSAANLIPKDFYTYFCPVCNLRCRSIPKLKFHFKSHLKEAHKGVTSCQKCETDFNTV